MPRSESHQREASGGREIERRAETVWRRRGREKKLEGMEKVLRESGRK